MGHQKVQLGALRRRWRKDLFRLQIGRGGCWCHFQVRLRSKPSQLSLLSQTLPKIRQLLNSFCVLTYITPPNSTPKPRYSVYWNSLMPANTCYLSLIINKVGVELSCGTRKLAGPKVNVDNGSASWYNTFEDLELELPSDKTQAPDLFINVIKFPTNPLKKTKRIGYLRIKISDLAGKGQVAVEPLLPDYFGAYKKDQTVTGFLQFK